eukprot:249590_1
MAIETLSVDYGSLGSTGVPKKKERIPSTDPDDWVPEKVINTDNDKGKQNHAMIDGKMYRDHEPNMTEEVEKHCCDKFACKLPPKIENWHYISRLFTENAKANEQLDIYQMCSFVTNEEVKVNINENKCFINFIRLKAIFCLLFQTFLLSMFIVYLFVENQHDKKSQMCQLDSNSSIAASVYNIISIPKRYFVLVLEKIAAFITCVYMELMVLEKMYSLETQGLYRVFFYTLQ